MDQTAIPMPELPEPGPCGCGCITAGRCELALLGPRPLAQCQHHTHCRVGMVRLCTRDGWPPSSLSVMEVIVHNAAVRARRHAFEPRAIVLEGPRPPDLDRGP